MKVGCDSITENYTIQINMEMYYFDPSCDSITADDIIKVTL